MPETVRDIYAGRHSIYQVVTSEDRLRVTIRASENHEERIELMSSVLSTLIAVLQEAAAELNRPPQR